MTHLPDGEYILTCDVMNPLPQRLHSRRRGWMRAAKWHVNTHFTLANGQWFCDICRGAANIGNVQASKVHAALIPHLKPWTATLPSELVPYGDCDDALDALFGLGKVTLDDVREAIQMRKTVLAIQHGLQDLCDPGDPPEEPPTGLESLRAAGLNAAGWSVNPVTGKATHLADMLTSGLRALTQPIIPPVGAAIPTPALAAAQALGTQAPSAPGYILRSGDVILDAEGSPAQLYVVVRAVSAGMYQWQNETGCEVFEQGWKSYREPLVGHIADMLTDGLRALATPLRPEAHFQLAYQAGGAHRDSNLDPFSLD